MPDDRIADKERAARPTGDTSAFPATGGVEVGEVIGDGHMAQVYIAACVVDSTAALPGLVAADGAVEQGQTRLLRYSDAASARATGTKSR